MNAELTDIRRSGPRQIILLSLHDGLDLGDPSFKICKFVAQLREIGGWGAEFHVSTAFVDPEAEEVILRKAQRAGDVGQGRSIPGLVNAVLDLAERRHRDAGSVGEFSLRYPACSHPLVDGLRYCCRVTHAGPPSQD
jgi:hypothetical protein